MSLKNSSTLAISIVSSAALLLSGCGSSNSNSSGSNSAGTNISGTVFASYVEGASVSARDVNGNEIAGPVISDEMGMFTLRIPDQHLSNRLIFTATGGQYKDEATGASTNNVSLSALIESDSLIDSQNPQFSLTPSSTIVERLVSDHGLNMSDAKSRFNEAFGYIPDTKIIPVDATQAPGEASEPSILAGLRAAIFSQLTYDLELPANTQSSLLALLADDLSDGNFDGMNNDEDLDLSASIQNRFNRAFSNFRSSGLDMSELNNASVGQRPFATTAMSDSYTVTYIPGMMDAMQGKTQFSFQIDDHQDNPVSGLTPSISPLMHMADRNHATPYTEVTEDSEVDGLYHASVYYLMASTMASGDSMGYWQLSIDLDENEESVVFYPQVMMAMGDTARVNLKSQSAMVPGMMGMDEKRTYILFNNGLSEDENGHNFSVFIATKENMMSFPALALGSYHELEVNSISVEMSTSPDDEESWVQAENMGTGVWTATELSHFDNSIFVRLKVNNEQTTDDGITPDGIGDEAEFMFEMESMESSDDMDHMHDMNHSHEMNDMNEMM